MKALLLSIFVLLSLSGTAYCEVKANVDGTFTLERDDMEECVRAQDCEKILEEHLAKALEVLSETEKQLKFARDMWLVLAAGGGVLSLILFFVGLSL